jgi:hypothetical protein
LIEDQLLALYRIACHFEKLLPTSSDEDMEEKEIRCKTFFRTVSAALKFVSYRVKKETYSQDHRPFCVLPHSVSDSGLQSSVLGLARYRNRDLGKRCAIGVFGWELKT